MPNKTRLEVREDEELRYRCLQLAVNKNQSLRTEHIVNMAKKFEEFVKGGN